MKRLVIIVLYVVLAVTMFISTVQAEGVQQVQGLREKLDSMFLKNYFSQEEIQQMKDAYIEYRTDVFFKYEMSQVIGKAGGSPIRNEDGSWSMEWGDEEWPVTTADGEVVYNRGPDRLAPELKIGAALRDYLDYYTLDFGPAVLATQIETMRYTEQYAKAGCFYYMFTNRYWAIPLDNTSNTITNDDNERPIWVERFNEDGSYLTKFNSGMTNLLVMGKAGWKFIQDYDWIEQLLREKGEISVSDIKLFSFSNYTAFMYIRCENREYLIKLYSNKDKADEPLWNIKRFTIYTVEDVLQQIGQDGWSEFTAAPKPIYLTEAEALQQEGLLHGNENGLDLLKPLTRIESAAMLLRALGLPETAPEGSPQVFTDVPATHWGFGAAAQAYSVGLVNGIGDNLFAPDQTVQANEFATMVLRAAETGEFDWQQAMELLIQQGVITETESETMDFFTRGDMAKIIYEARAKGLF